jgi:hypothetical protein
MFDDIVGYQLQWHLHVFVSIKRYFKIHTLDVGAAGMLITLFHMILDETISAVCVVSLYG